MNDHDAPVPVMQRSRVTCATHTLNAVVSVARTYVQYTRLRGVRLNITVVLGHRQLAVLAVGVRLGQVCEASLVVAAPEEPAADQERLPKLDEEVKRGAALSACEEVCVPRNVARCPTTI